MNQLAVVTGGGTGIGRALALHLASRGTQVLICGRRLQPLEQVHAAAANQSVAFVQADLATVEGQQAVIDKAREHISPLKWLVHNAGVLGGVKNVSSINMNEFRLANVINVEAPLAITQALLPLLQETHGRVLHISSGAAHSNLPGWTTYCTTKAAMHMLYKCLAAELGPLGVDVGSVRPGVVATEMQDLIRTSDARDFPMLDKFVSLHAQRTDDQQVHEPPTEGLDTADNVAAFLHFLLRDTSSKEFSAEEWDIRDAQHFPRWVPSISKL